MKKKILEGVQASKNAPFKTMIIGAVLLFVVKDITSSVWGYFKKEINEFAATPTEILKMSHEIERMKTNINVNIEEIERLKADPSFINIEENIKTLSRQHKKDFIYIKENYRRQ